MHITNLADSRRSAADRAWHMEQVCLNDCFHFAMQELLQSFQCFWFFLEKDGNFNRQKDFKQEHCFVYNFNMSNSKGSKKRKIMFLTHELYFKSAFESFLSFVLLQYLMGVLYCLRFTLLYGTF